MSKSLITVVAVLVLAALVVGGVGFWYVNRNSWGTDSWGTKETVSAGTSMPEVTEEPMSGTVETETPAGPVKEFTVEGSPFKFVPNTIKVKKGDTVKILFKNVSGTHDFVIDEFGVATNQIGTGEEEEVEFVADKTGTFEYYCSVGNHRAMGMVGKLIVE